MNDAADPGYTTLSSCRGCRADASNFSEVFRMPAMPLAGQFCLTAAEAKEAAQYPLTWLLCRGCGLVQVQEDISDRLLFTSYNYASSTVGPLVSHFQRYASLLAGEYGANTDLRFLEIGCNDGVLLNQLPSRWDRHGCDPSDVARRAAEKSVGNYKLVDRPFSPQTVVENEWDERFDVVSGSNCLAHISNLADVFKAAWMALRPGGHFWVEVHDLEALLGSCQWDTIYHEHKVEWSIDSLRECLRLAGFAFDVATRIPIHGGSLRCCFTKDRVSREQNGRCSKTSTTPFHELQLAFDQRYDTEAAQLLARTTKRGGRIAAYGASGRANVYLNQLNDLRFSYVVDEAALRIHKHLPCVAVPIVPPSLLLTDKVDVCLVTAWNYKEAITRKNPNFSGEWVTAFTEPCVSAS